MTALDVFRRCAAADREIDQIREKIERREALMTGRTARPLSPDGGGRGSGDASMRLVDYVANIEELRAKLEAREKQKASDVMCCLYLADSLEPRFSEVMKKAYLDHKGLKLIGEEMRYSVSQVKRLKAQAEDMCRSMEITYWDGVHVPLTAIRRK